MNRILSILSLLILAPTVIFWPWVVGLALAIPSRLLVGSFKPEELIRMYHGRLSFVSAEMLECVGAIWILGYFAVIVIYLILLFPMSLWWSVRIWLGIAVYFGFLLGVRPWLRQIWEVEFNPGVQTLFFSISGALLAVALLGILAAGVRRLRSGQNSSEA